MSSDGDTPAPPPISPPSSSYSLTPASSSLILRTLKPYGIAGAIFLVILVPALSILREPELTFEFFGLTPSPPIPEPPCAYDIKLNSEGLWTGPWSNSSGQGGPAVHDPVSDDVSSISDHIFRQRRLAEGLPGVDNGNLPMEKVLDGLDQGSLDTKDPVTVAFARLVELSIASFSKIDGVTSKYGERGLIKKIALESMALNDKFQPCLAHVRVLNGKVYFRYGYFLENRAKLQRINLSVKMIQEAIETYKLNDLKAELYLNACEQPQSFDNSLSPGRSGFPVFSTQRKKGSTDMLMPDPVDLTYIHEEEGDPAGNRKSRRTWRRMKPKAVFRGTTVDFSLKEGNYGASPRVRLHLMSSVRPDLLDAKIVMWGREDDWKSKTNLVMEGFLLGHSLPPSQMHGYKYTIVADESVGTREFCAALSAPQVAVKQVSAFVQFFEPFLIPGVHYVQVGHSFEDLFPALEWMQSHDGMMQRMVLNADDVAKWICTWEGRKLYWAVLLAKYSARCLEEPDAVEYPPSVCQGGKVISEPVAKTIPTCQLDGWRPCSDFCVSKELNNDTTKWTWLSADVLRDLPYDDPLGRRLGRVF